MKLLSIFSLILIIGCVNHSHFKYVKLNSDETKHLPLKLSQTELELLKRLNGKIVGNHIEIDSITIYPREKTISFPAFVNMMRGDIEVLIATEKGLLHEALFQSHISPFKLQLALILIGLKNGGFVKTKNTHQGSRVKVEIEYNNKKVPIQNFIFNNRKNENFKYNQFFFIGSNYNSAGQCLAEEQGNIMDLNSERNTDTIVSVPLHKEIISGYFIANTKTFHNLKLTSESIVNIIISQ